jgi:osmotically-inducible protein OsmY
MEAGVAVLRGSVASQREAELAATMLSFEPGISQIRNQIEVIKPSR